MNATILIIVLLFFSLSDTFHYDEISKNHHPDLKPGWPVLARYKDASDIEWLTWKRYFEISWLLMLLHFLVSELLRKYKKSLLPFWYVIFALGFVFIKFGIVPALLIILQPMLYIIGVRIGGSNSTTVIWVVSIIMLVGVNTLKSSEWAWQLADTDEDVNLIFIALGWTQVRCMSFTLDEIEKRNARIEKSYKNNESHNTKYLLLRILSYSLYFPTFLMGPIVMYSDFEKSFIEMETSLWLRLKRFIFDMTVMISYMYLMDIALHYIYFLALHSDVKYASALPSMALCGAGLWMGVQFHLKYVVMYGTNSALARLDHVHAPPTPRCIARIHLYSDMWKYFDVGLYTFLIKYIYKPLLTAMTKDNKRSTITNKLLASLVTFIFIFLWHGTTQSILVWSILNYIGVTLETLGTIFVSTENYSNFKNKILKTDRMEERFKAFISTPLLIMSALSNFYLFGGYNTGNVFVKRFFSESWHNIVFIYFCLYTCCNVSAALSDVPSRTAKNNTYN